MCNDDIECEAVWADAGGGGDIDSGIPTWIRLGGRGGGPICPFPDSCWAIAAIGFATTSQLFDLITTIRFKESLLTSSTW
jgi:hypothetical protein